MIRSASGSLTRTSKLLANRKTHPNLIGPSGSKQENEYKNKDFESRAYFHFPEIEGIILKTHGPYFYFMKCKDCSADIALGTLVCPCCGSRDLVLDENFDKPVLCKNCGTTNKASSEFCIECGKRIVGPVSDNLVIAGKKQPKVKGSKRSRKEKAVFGLFFICIALAIVGAGVYAVFYGPSILENQSRDPWASIMNSTFPTVQTGPHKWETDLSILNKCPSYITYRGNISIASTQKPVLKGTALILDIRATTSDAFGNGYSGPLDSSSSKLPIELQAAPSDKQITLFFVYEKYTEGKTPFSQGPEPGYANIAVVYWPSLEPVGRYCVYADVISSFPAKNQDIDSGIAEWVTGLYNPTIEYSQEQLAQFVNVTAGGVNGDFGCGFFLGFKRNLACFNAVFAVTDLANVNITILTKTLTTGLADGYCFFGWMNLTPHLGFPVFITGYLPFCIICFAIVYFLDKLTAYSALKHLLIYGKITDCLKMAGYLIV
jgi:hypothetical protein